MKIPLVLIRSKCQRKSPLARELFFSRFARNWANLFKSFKSFSYLFDLYRFVRFDFVDRWFCPLGHSFLVIILLHIVNIISNRTSNNFRIYEKSNRCKKKGDGCVWATSERANSSDAGGVWPQENGKDYWPGCSNESASRTTEFGDLLKEHLQIHPYRRNG